eukprot:3418059-Karenia_brevis.AAC.1
MWASQQSRAATPIRVPAASHDHDTVGGGPPNDELDDDFMITKVMHDKLLTWFGLSDTCKGA